LDTRILFESSVVKSLLGCTVGTCPRVYEHLNAISSSAADWPEGFSIELDRLPFMVDYEAVAFTEYVLYIFQADFDFKRPTATGYGKSKCG
jgi:hypothetical protein